MYGSKIAGRAEELLNGGYRNKYKVDRDGCLIEVDYVELPQISAAKNSLKMMKKQKESGK